MIKIYGMKTCPDCAFVDEQVKGNDRYEVIDIGEHVRNLKAFLTLRDNNPVFDDAKKHGYAGILTIVSAILVGNRTSLRLSLTKEAQHFLRY